MASTPHRQGLRHRAAFLFIDHGWYAFVFYQRLSESLVFHMTEKLYGPPRHRSPSLWIRDWRIHSANRDRSAGLDPYRTADRCAPTRLADLTRTRTHIVRSADAPPGERYVRPALLALRAPSTGRYRVPCTRPNLLAADLVFVEAALVSEVADNLDGPGMTVRLDRAHPVTVGRVRGRHGARRAAAIRVLPLLIRTRYQLRLAPRPSAGVVPTRSPGSGRSSSWSRRAVARAPWSRSTQPLDLHGWESGGLRRSLTGKSTRRR